MRHGLSLFCFEVYHPVFVRFFVSLTAFTWLVVTRPCFRACDLSMTACVRLVGSLVCNSLVCYYVSLSLPTLPTRGLLARIGLSDTESRMQSRCSLQHQNFCTFLPLPFPCICSFAAFLFASCTQRLSFALRRFYRSCGVFVSLRVGYCFAWLYALLACSLCAGAFFLYSLVCGLFARSY